MLATAVAIAWLMGPSSLGTVLGEGHTYRQPYPGPVTEGPGNKISGCFPALRGLRGDTAKALWEPRRAELFYCDGEDRTSWRRQCLGQMLKASCRPN